MKSNIGADLKADIAAAIKSALATGSGSKKLQVYSGSMPEAAGGSITTQTKLLEFTISPSSWSIESGALVVPAMPAVSAIASGVARWARFVDGNGAVVMDVDVTSTGGNGFIKLTSAAITAGSLFSVAAGHIMA